METNFFQQIEALQPAKNSEWLIVIKNIEGQQIVSVLYKDESCGDNARKIIPPLTFNESPQRIDQCFFEDMHSAFSKTFGIFNNMEHYLKQQEKAQLESKMEKDKEKKTKLEKTPSEQLPVKTDREKKYENGLKLAADLEAQGKYQDAWMKVPDPADYPEHVEFLRKRREEISINFPPSLFS
ncbi:prtrc system protein e [Taibaiella chishuiensis]|uniref:ParB-related ThiF-related cassette protein E domain-containing protein n=1 Tax=Taibaiella chishuiensis TaxID=1434707 RepID=A0A2P8D0V8_9BACT|nr:prtrc system protein e [Taibaiella chishuiensis]PSK90850.1 hypothetical protein B0I18_107262 [Taibaiella chishuiensis]